MGRHYSPGPQDGYDSRWFAPLADIEDRHFWFRARNQVISAVVKQLTFDLPRGYRVLELGCGTGNVLRELDQLCTGGTVIGLDLFGEGLDYAASRSDALLIQGDMRALPFGTPFDLIGMFDVLEHVSDDRRLLSGLRSLLADNGRLVLTVPAHPYLWSSFDEASHHCRRYAMPDLRACLIDSGYEVEYATLYMLSLFPLMWLRRHFKTLSRQPCEDRQLAAVARDLAVVPVVNELLAWLLTSESWLIARRCHLPMGTSVLAVARHKEDPGK